MIKYQKKKYRQISLFLDSTSSVSLLVSGEREKTASIPKFTMFLFLGILLLHMSSVLFALCALQQKHFFLYFVLCKNIIITAGYIVFFAPCFWFFFLCFAVVVRRCLMLCTSFSLPSSSFCDIATAAGCNSIILHMNVWSNREQSSGDYIIIWCIFFSLAVCVVVGTVVSFIHSLRNSLFTLMLFYLACVFVWL